MQQNNVEPHNHTAERENGKIYMSARAGNKELQTLWWVGGLSKWRVGVCVCACPSRAAGIISSCQ